MSEHEIPPAHRFDEAALSKWLRGRVPGFGGDIRVAKFSDGQSNPTYRIDTPAGAYVLRKKPAGKLLPSAHAIDREYRVMSALAGSGVPVPKMHVLCDDESVIGQAFYLMAYVEGRVLMDATIPGETPAGRRAIYLELVEVLARLHRVDWRGAGLEGFGRPERYVERQLSRWTTQYLASKVEENADMNGLIEWLGARVPAGDESAINHGDYRTHNVMYHPTEPRIVAVLDWELSTIGHPLADLGYCCLPYYLPADDIRGFRGGNPTALGIPTEEELTAAYARAVGRDGLPDWRFFIAFSLFRSAAIRAGIYKRALEGNAASTEGFDAGLRYRTSAKRGHELAQQWS